MFFALVPQEIRKEYIMALIVAAIGISILLPITFKVMQHYKITDAWQLGAAITYTLLACIYIVIRVNIKENQLREKERKT